MSKEDMWLEGRVASSELPSFMIMPMLDKLGAD